ncbi:hypothetical protein MTO96_046512 [Rhipicephalus appendiculatus]
MEDGSPADEQASAARKRGPPFKDSDEPRRKNKRVSYVDRARIIDACRRGGDVKQLAETLGINVKTARSIAAIDREASLKTGGSVRKFGEDVVAVIRTTVDEKPTFTLKQIKRAVEEQLPGLTISTSSVDRLLDAHTYSMKLATQRPADRNRSDVKRKRKRLRAMAAERWAPAVSLVHRRNQLQYMVFEKIDRSKKGRTGNPDDDGDERSKYQHHRLHVCQRRRALANSRKSTLECFQ